MGRWPPPLVLVAAVVLACASAACRCPSEEPVAPPPEPHSSRGVKVPLPDGWSARLGKEQSLAVGPAGHAVLRIDLRPGAAAGKPDAAELRRLFSAAFDAGEATAVASRDAEGYSWVVFHLGGREDAGTGEKAMLGAKTLGDDLFLCATFPGTTAPEVESATRACEGLTYSAMP